ncbi:MAG: rhomboid family intramembrane serine protease [Bacilli bacterium]|nr:rhomboid family intramembrane serine protease [Bacilli bacterium]
MEQVSEKELLIMELIHYFMIKKNYTPVIIRGIDNEIWLENPNGEFRIIRIVTKEIFNNEQFDFDEFKTKNIVGQIKRKTFNPFIDVLTIYLEMGDNFKKKNNDNKFLKYVYAYNEDDLFNNEIINSHYSDLKTHIKSFDDETNILGKITTDISQKNFEENERLNNMYNQKKTIVTHILIFINLLVFLLMYIIGNGSESTETLIKFGALNGMLVKSGEYYRIITSAFIHIGIFHILCNMYALYSLGPIIEHFFGRLKFLLIYLYSAIIGSLFVLIFNGDNVISAGASGAIFGLLGSLIYFGYTYRGYIGNKMLNQVIPVIILNLLIGFTTPGISNAAHIGGLIGGFAISYMFGSDNNNTISRKVSGIIVTLVLTIFIIYLSLFQ